MAIFCRSEKKGASTAVHGHMKNVRTKFAEICVLPEESTVMVTSTGSPPNVALADIGLESAPASKRKSVDCDPSVYSADRSNSKGCPVTTASNAIAAEKSTMGRIAEQPGQNQSSE
jgi:hypothetical protein